MAKAIQNPQMTADEAFKLMHKVKDDPDHQIVFNLSIIKLPPYLTTQQVMDLIGCSRSHVNILMTKGTIKKVHTAVGQLRFDRKEIQRIIAEGLV